MISNENTKPKSIILVDDHEMILFGLKTYLETKTPYIVSGIAKSISEAKELLAKKSPDLFVIDVDLGTENGFDLSIFLKTNFPFIKIIMYSMHDENAYVLRAKQLDIDGYISKGSDSEEFVKCINKVFEDKVYIEERLSENQNIIDEVLVLLTKKEALIFQEMLKCKSNEEISQALKISKHSVEVYASTIYEKTFCKNRMEFLQKYK